MTPFGRGEAASRVPEECWLLSSLQVKLIFGYPSGVWETGASFGPDRHELVLLPSEFIPLPHLPFTLLRFKALEVGNLSCQS